MLIVLRLRHPHLLEGAQGRQYRAACGRSEPPPCVHLNLSLVGMVCLFQDVESSTTNPCKLEHDSGSIAANNSKSSAPIQTLKRRSVELAGATTFSREAGGATSARP